MKEILLTQEQITQVDDEDYEWLNQWKWHAHKNNDGTYYATRREKITTYKYKTIFMHKLLLNTNNKLQGDHIDGNKLNNQRSNLRSATYTQNNINRVFKNTTGYRGVSFNKRMNKFQAYITINGKMKGLGYFDDAIIAATKYNKYALKYHGEFAVLNII